MISRIVTSLMRKLGDLWRYGLNGSGDNCVNRSCSKRDDVDLDNGDTGNIILSLDVS